MKRRRAPSQTLTRYAFAVVIVFVLAQVSWWLIFQHRYITQVTQRTLDGWQRDAATLSDLAERANLDEAQTRELLAAYAHLRVDEATGRFQVDRSMVREFQERQQGHVRMLAFEGPFFVFVVLLGLYIIARSLRAERELKRRQQNFLSAITHEFKTPMSTLRLLIETAMYRPLSAEKQRNYLSRMNEELARLEQTSEQVLAAARLEQAEQATVLASGELNEVVSGIADRVRGGLEARGATLTVIHTSEPLPVSVDEGAYAVVLSNLLDNAVKYSPGPQKSITIRLERQGDLIFAHVEDEGVGLETGEANRIFDRFYRVGSELTRNAKGVGLGLYLVKTITEAMNGWVRCEPNDRAGRGTRFTIVLPRRVTLTRDEQVAASGRPAVEDAR